VGRAGGGQSLRIAPIAASVRFGAVKGRARSTAKLFPTAPTDWLVVAGGAHVQQVLRHSKVATTMETYTHVPSEVTRRALKQLGASLDGLSS
jgi:hypothetical protein